MRKIALLVMGLFISTSFATAQDTLLWENFEDTLIGGINDAYIQDFPPGNFNDTTWYNYDEDVQTDANARPNEWYLVAGGFTVPDTLDICLMSSSWFSTVATASNWLFLPAIQITDGASAWLKWKSAPRQTPYYLDGYEIRISTTSNDYQTAYTDIAYTAAEYETGAPTGSNNYGNYTFSSPGFIHGLDGNYVDCSACLIDTDSARQIGVQRPDSISLAAYDDMVIYIAFHHNATDDNLISLDDILIIENTDPTFDIEPTTDFSGQVYPNPATDFVNVKFDIEKYHNMGVQMVNSNGQVVYNASLNTVNHRIDVTSMAAGVYFIKVTADEGSMVEKVVVNK